MVGLYGYAPPPPGGLTIHQMFVYRAGIFDSLGEPSTEYSHPYGINNNGHIAGGRTQKGFRRGFIHRGGVFTDLMFPGADDTSAYDINDHGHVVGWYTRRSEGVTHGFLWVDGQFTTLDYPDASSTTIYGINDAGMIVGGYRTKGGFVSGFMATPGTAAARPRTERLQIERHLGP
jgi:probable HAF family extracellular repeat protein